MSASGFKAFRQFNVVLTVDSKYRVRGRGVNNFDMTLLRSFKFGERKSADFRVDMRNAFNHTQFSGASGIDVGMGNSVIGSTFAAGGSTPDWTTLTTVQQARFGHSTNGNFGTFNPAAAATRSPRYVQLSITLKF